jgi:hypothetical protein
MDEHFVAPLSFHNLFTCPDDQRAKIIDDAEFKPETLHRTQLKCNSTRDKNLRPSCIF